MRNNTITAARDNLFDLAAIDRSPNGQDAPNQMVPNLDLLSIVKSESIKPSTPQPAAKAEAAKFVDQTEGRAPFFYAWELKDKLNTMKPVEAKAFVEELQRAQKGNNVPEVLLTNTKQGTNVEILDRMSNPDQKLPVARITDQDVNTDTRKRFFANSREHQLATMGAAAVTYGAMRTYGTLALGARFNPKVALLELAGTLVVSAVTSPRIYEWFDGI